MQYRKRCGSREHYSVYLFWNNTPFQSDINYGIAKLTKEQVDAAVQLICLDSGSVKTTHRIPRSNELFAALVCYEVIFRAAKHKDQYLECQIGHGDFA